MILNREFLRNEDPVFLARALLGVTITAKINNRLTSSIISETEAYKAPEDKASHAYGNRRTNRTETMFGEAGFSYVYLCYGIHHLFNIVTGPVDTPHAVLIRGIIPSDGIDMMRERRKGVNDAQLTNGPGKWTKAFAISTELNGIDLLDNNSNIQLHGNPGQINDKNILATPRIGIDYAEEFIQKPWRFVIK